MKVLIDGDCCNKLDTITQICQKKEIPVLLFCDWTRWIDSDYVEVHTVDKGRDSADFALLNYVVPGDVVVTQDAGLASMALAKKAYVIHNRGIQFTKYNINTFLNKRFLRERTTRKTGRYCKGLNLEKQPNYCFGHEFYKLVNYAQKQAQMNT